MKAKTNGKAWLTALVLAVAVVLSGLAAEEPVVDLIPSETDLIGALNVRSLVDSNLFGAVIDQAVGRAEFDDEIRRIKEMSGVDLTRDVDRIYWFGRPAPRETREGQPQGILLAEGRFNQETLVALAREERGYGTTEAGGRTVHVWHRSGRTHGACFLSDKQLLLSDQCRRLMAYLEAHAAGRVSKGSKKEIRRVIGAMDKNTLMIVYSPSGHINSATAELSRRHEVSSVLFELRLLDDQVMAEARVGLDSSESAANVFAIANGGPAFPRMATTEDPQAQKYLNAITVQLGEDRMSVGATFRIGNDAVVEALKQGGPKVASATRQMGVAVKDLERAVNQAVGGPPTTTSGGNWSRSSGSWTPSKRSLRRCRPRMQNPEQEKARKSERPVTAVAWSELR